LEDSNMANYGSKEHRDLRKEAAASDPAFKGAGQKPGLEVWRVENKRTENDTPDFGVARWPKEDYGSFYSGDSYIVLNTYQLKDPETGKLTDKLAWDVHFWLGQESSQDEIGVAAYKTVELDDLLDDGPVQHRETQGHESKLFLSYFKEIQYMEGGIESGFRKVKPEEYVPRLFHIRKASKTTRAFQVDTTTKAMNQGDSFVLDAGRKVYVWHGEAANAFEKQKAGAFAHNIIASRMGKAKKAEVDDQFWEILGDEKDIQGEDAKVADDAKIADPKKYKLFRISDASGKMKMTLEAEGDSLTMDMLDSDDCFLIDGDIELFVWCGKGATKDEKDKVFIYADQYIRENGKDPHISVAAVKEGQMNHSMATVFKY